MSDLNVLTTRTWSPPLDEERQRDRERERGGQRQTHRETHRSRQRERVVFCSMSVVTFELNDGERCQRRFPFAKYSKMIVLKGSLSCALV